MLNLYRVRYYGYQYHPDLFKMEGWRGTLVRILNWVRWRIEVVVIGLVLEILAKKASLMPEDVSQIRRTHRAQLKRDEAEKEENIEPTVLATMLSERTEIDAEPLTQTEPLRKTSVLSFFERQTAEGRSRRYTGGRSFRVYPNDDAFEPVDSNNKPQKEEDHAS